VTTVIDSTLLVAYLLQEKGHDLEKISELLKNGVLSCELIIWESANAILTSERRGAISSEDSGKVLEALQELITINIKVMPQLELVSEAFRIAKENNLAVYDAVFLAACKSPKSGFASYDGRQLNVARKLGIRVPEIP
jgi:predicted nucleic acid-binding protein